jgi:hypothetical protein
MRHRRYRLVALALALGVLANLDDCAVDVIARGVAAPYLTAVPAVR